MKHKSIAATILALGIMISNAGIVSAHNDNFTAKNTVAYNEFLNLSSSQVRTMNATEEDVYKRQDNNNTALVDKIADDKNQYDTFNVNEEVENVMNIINQLSEEDKNLITNLLIKNKTERELSALMGVSQPAIHKRKKRIIENIKNKSKK